MFAITTVLTGWVAYGLKIPLEQAALFQIGLILGAISAIFVIVEPHRQYLTWRFKEKDILETIYFKELQDKIAGLAYFLPATGLITLLVYVHPFPTAYQPIKSTLYGIGGIVLLFEFWRLYKDDQLLSNRITRVRPFFKLLKDPETKRWGFGQKSLYKPAESTALEDLRNDLIDAVFSALASKNWAQFEMIEKDWLTELKWKLQEIGMQAKTLETIWTTGAYPLHQKNFTNKGIQKISEFQIYMQGCLDDLRLAGYPKKSPLDEKKFVFLVKACDLLDTLKNELPNFRSHAIHEIDTYKHENQETKSRIIEAICLEVLGLKYEVTPDFQDKISPILNEKSYVTNHPEIKEFSDFLRLLIRRIGDISDETLTETAFEVQWVEVPDSLKRIT